MARKSQRAAAKYSQASREKRQRRKGPLQRGMPTAPGGVVERSAPPPSPQWAEARTSLQPRLAPSSRYLASDLRRIGVIAAVMLVILVVLTFVLG